MFETSFKRNTIAARPLFAGLVLSGFFLALFSCGWKSDNVQEAEEKGGKKSGDVRTVYQFRVKTIDGKKLSLRKYAGKVLLIVNVASKCGHTPQYADLQKLYEEYRDDGLAVLGFPANNFMEQEPGSNAEIKQFCTTEFGVSFPMFAKISVKGENMAPLYAFLTSKAKNGVLDAPVKWNFQKFVIDRSGQVAAVIEPARKVYHPAALRVITNQLAKGQGNADSPARADQKSEENSE